MADIAALNLAVNSDSVKQATVELKAMAPAASAAERAAQKWGMTTSAAARSTEDFSKRVQRTIRDLEFERQQLTRNTAEKERYSMLRRAGVAEASAEGRAILASVTALHAQRAANKANTEATRAASSELALLGRFLGPAAVAYLALAKAQEVWQRALKAGDLGEQAEQIGISTDQLQAYRFAGAQAGIQTEQMDTAITKLAKTMGAANDGGKEQIDLFEKLGVKLLDAQGQLRPVADVLPEVARGVLNIGSSSERTATLMDLFGRSGAKMSTVLEDIAQGNDSVVAKARAAGVVLDAEVIAAWDRVSDSMVRAQLAGDATYAKLGAPIATAGLDALEKVLKSINGLMDQINSKEGFWSSILEESRSKGRIGSGPNALRLETPAEALARRRAELERELKNPNNAGREAMIQEDLNRLGSRDVVSGGFYGEDMAGAASKGTRATAISVPGVRNPVAKGGGTDPYAKAIEGAKEYILSKKAETEAVGQTVLAAAQLKHEQDLLNKATGEGKTLSDAQKSALKDLAGQMAQADNALATAKYMDDARTKSEEFLAQQQLERDSLFLSAEAANRLKLETEMLNAAKRQGIELSPTEVEAIKASADAMAQSQEKTRRMTEEVSLAKDVAKGFFSDISQELRNGATIWEAFGTAAENALNKIADKLISMAVDDLFNAAFPGSSGGGGAGGIAGTIMNLFGGSAGGGVGVGSGFTFAKGGAFRAGNVIPFASGGMVSSPTVFPMSRGRTGLMGEAGPEAIMPLRRGSDGRLGVQATGGGGAGASGQISITVTGDTDLVRVTARDEFDRKIAVTGPQIEARAVKKANEQAPAAVARNKSERGGDWRD